MNWRDTVAAKISELELMASWASIVQLGRVRDQLRLAIAELRHELKRLDKSGE